ncbi:MAG TPA: hypothetical protein VGA37_05200 [Gemmatimonadales bacterium]
MTGSHIDDGDLLRWIDRECDGFERDMMGRHLATCAICDGRVSVIEAWSAAFRAALRSRVGRRANRRWLRRLAAAAAIAMAVGLTVEPVRAWVAHQAVAVWSMVTGTATTAQPGILVPAPGEPASASLTFAPEGPRFELHVDVWQETGDLTMTTVADTQATATVLGGDGREELFVLPSGLRIVNDPGSRADYQVQVPASMREIRVTVGDGAVRSFAPGQPGASRTIAVVRIP